MYDKVKLWLPRTRHATDIAAYLDNAKEQTDLKTGEVCSIYGGYAGIKVDIHLNGIFITGSLPKFLLSNNIYSLDRHSTAEAIKKLSDGLHLPLDEAKVIELEFGQTFVMKHPVIYYLTKLGEMPRMLRCSLTPGTLYYKPKGKRQPKMFVFYDKGAEATGKGGTLPTGFDEVNLLRYEMRFKGRLPQQLNAPEVTASTLSESEFYRQMVQRYQRHYFSILKLNQIKIKAMDKIKTVSDAYNVFVANLIAKSGQAQIEAFFNALKENNTFKDRKYYTRLKNKIKSTATKAKFTEIDELAKELDNEINNVGAYV